MGWAIKMTVSQEWTNGINSFFLHAGRNSGKLKVDSVIFGWAWSKMAVVFYFMRPWNLLYLNKKKFMNSADFFNVDSDAIVLS